jgi:hypothetical protein
VVTGIGRTARRADEELNYGVVWNGGVEDLHDSSIGDLDNPRDINAIDVEVDDPVRFISAHPEGTGSGVDTYFGGPGEWNYATPSRC